MRAHQRRFWLSPREIYKFSTYLLMPVACFYVAANPSAMDAIMRYTAYVYYPAEGSVPANAKPRDMSEETEFDRNMAKLTFSALRNRDN